MKMLIKKMKNRFSINFFQLRKKSSEKTRLTHQYFMAMMRSCI
nr:MAG TPA: hypothetical protein [Bacteriophage sp.]